MKVINMSKSNKKQVVKSSEEVVVIDTTVEEVVKKSRSKVEVISLSDEQLKTYEQLENKSMKIRFLLDLNYNRSSIAKHLGIIYQHVRNVEITPVKRKKIELGTKDETVS